MARLMDIPAVLPFDVDNDPSSLAQRWIDWRRKFSYYLAALGTSDDNRKKALLLHLAGSSVQDVYDTLQQAEDKYEDVLKRLTDHFDPKKNVTYERHAFRSAVQMDAETIDQFVTRLKKLSLTCEFEGTVSDMIRDQVVDKCSSTQLRRRFLREPDLTLEKAQTIARSIEMADRQAVAIEITASRTDVGVAAANALDSRKFQRAKPTKWGYNRAQKFDGQQCYRNSSVQKSDGQQCYRCGVKGHYARDCRITKDKLCNTCGKVGHFSKMCRTKVPVTRPKKFGNRTNAGVNVMEPHSSSEILPSSASIFQLRRPNEDACRDVLLNGYHRRLLIDSGSELNVLDREMFESVRRNDSVVERSSVKVYPYGCQTPLNISGKVDVQLSVNNCHKKIPFLIVEGRGGSLLGRKTAEEVGLLKLLPLGVNTITDELSATARIVGKFPECFNGLGKLKDFQLALNVDTNVIPVAQPLRPMPFHMRKEVEKQLRELEKADVIERAEGPTPWVSALVAVPKPSGDIRLCVDMRQANQAIIRERFPMPNIDETLQEMQGSVIFSTLDLKSGFHQNELQENSRSITTFVTHEGLYRYKRLSFGISSAPEVYQRIIQQVLQGCEGTVNISDDIIVHGKSSEEHDQRLEKVLKRLNEKGLTLNQSKCKFYQTRLRFMGHVLSSRGIEADDSKIAAIQNAKAPTSAKEVRSFLGLVTYCAKFIPHLSTIAEPLRRLTKKNAEWIWGNEQQQAFERLRNILASAEVMVYYNPDAKTKLVVDASPVGLGAILQQKQIDGTYRPVLYASRSLNPVEQRYSQTEREALAVAWGCEKFQIYLYGMDFTVVTDHKPLVQIFSPTHKPPPRIQRWVLRLQSFRFKMEYQPGELNAADVLSRSPYSMDVAKENAAEEYIHFIVNHATPIAMSLKEILEQAASDELQKRVRDAILTGNWIKSEELKPYMMVKDELSVDNAIILRGNRIVIPKKLQERVLQLAHEGHQGIVKTKSRLREKVWWPGIDNAVERLISSCHACQVVGSKPENPHPMQMTTLPSGPWKDLAMDICGPFPQGDYLLVVIDYYSRFPEVEILRTVTTNTVTQRLQRIFATHGIPETITTDNGPQFVSREFENFMLTYNVRHRRVTPFWPSANGEVERFNLVLKKHIQATTAEGLDWKKKLHDFLLIYRATSHCTTGRSPAELLYGRQIKTKLPEHPVNYREASLDDVVRKRDSLQKEKMKAYADSQRRSSQKNLNVGDKVLVRHSTYINKQTSLWQNKLYTVIQVKGSAVYLKSPTGQSLMRNISHVKKYDTAGREGGCNLELELDDFDDVPQTENQVGPSRPVEVRDQPPKRNKCYPSRFRDYLFH